MFKISINPRALSTDKIQLFDVPLILYCYSEKCNVMIN